MPTPLLAMIRKDLLLFFNDRRSVILSFVVPIAIASFFGSLFSGPSKTSEPAKIDVSIVDQDGSTIAKEIVSGAQTEKTLRVATPTLEEARVAVQKGKTTVAVVVPAGFGTAAAAAFVTGSDKPTLDFLYDPSHSMELAVVRGVLTQHVIQAVSKEVFNGSEGRALVERSIPEIETSGMPEEQKKALLDLLKSLQHLQGLPQRSPAEASNSRAPGFGMPYEVREEAMTAGRTPYNGYAHSFGGMAIQFLLFAMANLGVEVLLERKRGLWKRLRSAPIARFTLLLGKAVSGTLISMMILLVSFAFAILVFRVRIEGSVVGFLAVALACSMMAACFGLLVAALGNSPGAARGITTLAVLMMVMLGGAWVPSFVFPGWLQRATLVVPVRWAVDGLDAMTWRGIGLQGALAPTAALLGFAALFGAIAAARFQWEET